MRAGAYTQNGLHALGDSRHPAMPPTEWLRLATLGGARGWGWTIGSARVEAGKEADLIVVDPPPRSRWAMPATSAHDGPDEIMSRLIYRPAGHGPRRLGARAPAPHLSRR